MGRRVNIVPRNLFSSPSTGGSTQVTESAVDVIEEPADYLTVLQRWMDKIDPGTHTPESLMDALKEEHVLVISKPFTREQLSEIAIIGEEFGITLDDYMKSLEKSIQDKLVVEERDGDADLRYDGKKMPRRIRRNLFEREGGLQQADFGFSIDDSDLKKTMLMLNDWVAQQPVDGAIKIFILIFVSYYQLVSHYMKEKYGSTSMSDFWKLPLERRKELRPVLNDSESWISHPLTPEEDADVILEIGRRESARIRREKADKVWEKKQLEIGSILYVSNAKIRFLTSRLKDCTQKILYLETHFDESLASEFDDKAIETKKQLFRIQEELLNIINKLGSINFYDHRTKKFYFIFEQDPKKIQESLEANLEYLLSQSYYWFVKYADKGDD